MKFSVGEIAILRAVRPEFLGRYTGPLPVEAEIVRASPELGGILPDGRRVWVAGEDYAIHIPVYGCATVKEWQLRKRPHKGLPESITRIFEIKEIA